MQVKTKKEREEKALEQIKKQFPDVPEIGSWIGKKERSRSKVCLCLR